MKKYYLLTAIAAILIYMIVLKISHTEQKAEVTVPVGEKYVILSVDEVTDKIRGGLLGQILVNLNGLPHEMKYIDEPGNVENYVPSLQEDSWSDDDTDLEWIYVVEIQNQRNLFLTHCQILDLWKKRIHKRIWCSNLFARNLMDIGIKPPLSGNALLNPWANFNISGQFICETFGLIAPAMPLTAAQKGLNYTTVAIDNEPAQATQLFTTMIATSFFEKDIGKIVDAGILALDRESRILEIISDVRNGQIEYPADWRETRRLLKNKYTLEGDIRDSNGCVLNTGSVLAALLYGKGDFAETIKYAFNFEWAADCNAATAGTIAGVICSYRKMLKDWQIVDRYRNVTRENMPMNENITSFTDRIYALFEIINRQNGGERTVHQNIDVFRIVAEEPAPVKKSHSLPNHYKILERDLEYSISEDLLLEDKERLARAVYLSVCLNLDGDYAKDYPQQWQEA